MSADKTFVCGLDGVPVMESRSGIWVHTDLIPREIDPDHAAQPVGMNEWLDYCRSRTDLKLAVEDMLAHHAALHPAGDCPWAARLIAASRKV